MASLREYEPMVMKRIAQMCDQLEKRQCHTFDLNECLGYLVFDGKSITPWFMSIRLADGARSVTTDLAYGNCIFIPFHPRPINLTIFSSLQVELHSSPTARTASV